MHALPRPDRRAVLVAVVVLVGVAGLLAAPGLLRDDLGEALGTVADANPLLLWVACACFTTLVVAMGLAWRAGVQALGGETSRMDAAARYGAGSLTGAIVPAGAGGAVRIGLFSRVLPPPDRLWRAGGISAAVTAARALALAVLVGVAASLGALPLWPVAIFLGAGAAAVAVAYFVRGREIHSHVGHLFDVFAALGRSPQSAATLVAWTSAALLARATAAGVVCAALGLPDPATTGVVAIAALSIAGMVQLTPGNIGVAGGALALALAARGMDADEAMSVGIAFQAVETATSLVVGSVAVLYLAQHRLAGWPLRLAGAGAGAVVVAAVGLTFLAV